MFGPRKRPQPLPTLATYDVRFGKSSTVPCSLCGLSCSIGCTEARLIPGSPRRRQRAARNNPTLRETDNTAQHCQIPAIRGLWEYLRKPSQIPAIRSQRVYDHRHTYSVHTTDIQYIHSNALCTLLQSGLPPPPVENKCVVPLTTKVAVGFSPFSGPSTHTQAGTAPRGMKLGYRSVRALRLSYCMVLFSLCWMM